MKINDCPKCGSDKIAIYDLNHLLFKIGCENCGHGQSCWFGRLMMAVRAWNERGDDDEY